jgi:hypothetical protein
VTCEEFVAELSQGSSSIVVDFFDHAAVCPACRELYRVDYRLRAELPRMPLIGMAPELRAALARHQRADQPLPRWLRVLAILAISTACITAEWIWLPRIDIAFGAPRSFWISSAILAGWWISVWALQLHRGRFGLGLPDWTRWLGAAMGLMGFELLAYGHAHGLLRVTGGPEGHFQPPHDCLLQGLAVAAIVGIALLVMNRRTVVHGAASAGALTGCVAGLASVLALHAHCHAAGSVHLQVVHGLPVLLAIAVGTFAGRRWLAA